MISRKFLEIVGYLRTADKRRPNVNAMIGRKPLILSIVWGATGLILLMMAGAIFSSSGGVIFPLLTIGLCLLAIGGVWNLWSGPFGLDTKIYEEGRSIRICYRDAHAKFQELPRDQHMVVFGLMPFRNGRLELSGPAKVLTKDMLKRDAIGEDLRLDLGAYTYLGIAFMGPFGEPQVSHEDLMLQAWIKDALKAGLSESDIHNFTRNLDVAS